MTDIHPGIRKNIDVYAQSLQDLSKKVHKDPELAFLEKNACKMQVDYLMKLGFTIQTPFAGLETAYKAVKGEGSPVFCFMAEYDALPEIGHACGHNLICAAAIGAGASLYNVMEEENIPGTVVVMGTPGEEGKGGKVEMIKNGALEGIDAAMLAHPSSQTIPDNGCTAIKRFRVSYKGKASHAAGSPEKGKNALDGVLLLFQGVNAWRQHLIETCRVHGIVKEGGAAPNIIPDCASCEFYIRALEDNVLDDMIGRFRDIAQGAALMSGTQVDIEPKEPGYRARVPNQVLNKAYVEAAEQTGLEPEVPESSGRGSSDFGDVSQVVPGAHVYFSISKEEPACHSVAFREAAGSKYGLDQMLKAAEALANVGYVYFMQKEFRDRVNGEFAARGTSV